MKVNYTDTDYENNIDFLQFIDDLYKGTREVKANGQKYLFPLSLEKEDKYNERLKQATFENYVKKAIDNTNSMLYRKELKLDYSMKYESFFSNVDGEGNSLEIFMQQVSKNAIKDGLSYIWVDSPSIDTTTSALIQKSNTIVPFFKLVKRMDVLSKKYMIIDGKKYLSQVVIKQAIQTEINDFETEEDEVYFVLTIGGGEVYKSNKKNFELIGSWENTLGYIPLVPVYSSKSGFLEADIPFLDLAFMNLKLYNKQSDLDYIEHMTTVPLIAIYDFDTKGQDKVQVGVNSALLFDDKQKGGIEIIEVQGNNIQNVRASLQSLKDDMDKLALTLISKSNFKTATEAKIQEKSTSLFLVEISKNIENATKLALEMAQDFVDADFQYTLEMVKDFDDLTLDANEIDKLIAMKREGIISIETLWDALIKGEVLALFDYDLEKQRLKDEMSQVL